MATITTGSEKQVAWAQQLIDERITLMTRAAKGAAWKAEQLRADGSEKAAEKVAARAAAITTTVALLEQVTDARPVIDQRDRGAHYVLHVAGVGGREGYRVASSYDQSVLRVYRDYADEAGL